MVGFGSRLVIIDSGEGSFIFYFVFQDCSQEHSSLNWSDCYRFSQLEESTSRGNIKCQNYFTLSYTCTVRSTFYSCPGWDASLSQGSLQHGICHYPFTCKHLIKRGTVRVKDFAQEHNAMSSG